MGNIVMAQTGFTPIQLYSTSTAAAAPTAGNLTNSTLGSELAINITDGKLFYKDNANAVQVIGWKTVPTTAGGTGLTTYTAGDLSYYATGTTFTKLAIGTIGQILTSTGSAPQWTTLSGVAVTTFSAGTTGFTPNSATSGAITLAGTLVAVNGGTGQSSYTTGDLLFASSTTALSKLADVATGNALISGGVGVAPLWGKIGLTTHVSGTLPTANGGTNLTGFTAANNAIYSTSSSALTAGTLPVAAGGTGMVNLNSGWVPYGNGTSPFNSSADFYFSGTNLGLGTTAPVYRLNVAASDTTNTVGGSAAAINITNTNAGAFGRTMDLNFSVGGGTVAEKLTGLSAVYTGYTTSVGGALAFCTNNGSSSYAERMRVHSSGGVSIGNTTDPGATNLSVSGDLLFNSGYGSVATAYGCRAWVNFNGTGTVAIRASGNVSSVTDNGVGLYTVNFTNNMPDVNYATVVDGQHSTSAIFRITPSGTYAVGGVQVDSTDALQTARVDVAIFCVSVFR
jgi:hypothetical protein